MIHRFHTKILPVKFSLLCLSKMIIEQESPWIDLNELKQYTLDSAKPVEAKRGDVLFFHCCTIHGSMPNLSDKPRKTILIQLYSGKDKVIDNNKHTNIQLVLRGWNHHATRNSVSTIKS